MICWNLQPGQGTPQKGPWEAARILPPSRKFPGLLQLPLFIEVQDSILEVMHLAEDKGLVKDIAKAATLQQGDGLCVKLLFDLGKEESCWTQGKNRKSLGTRQVNHLPLAQFPLH